MTIGLRHRTRLRRHLLVASLGLILGVALTPSPATAQSACGAYYTIGAGDTLAEIAERCGVTLPALVAANPGLLGDNELGVGERLRMPMPDAPEPSPVEACGPSYTVRTGDTLAEIAATCGLSIPLLVAANPPLPEPLGVHAGLVIRIPDVSPDAVRDSTTLVAPTPVPAGAGASGAASPDSAAIPAAELIRVQGVLEQGADCMAVRDENGALHAIVGELWAGLRPGDRVVLLGVPGADDACEISPAIELRILYRARP